MWEGSEEWREGEERLVPSRLERENAKISGAGKHQLDRHVRTYLYK
jgi:hypothetical protein